MDHTLFMRSILVFDRVSVHEQHLGSLTHTHTYTHTLRATIRKCLGWLDMFRTTTRKIFELCCFWWAFQVPPPPTPTPPPSPPPKKWTWSVLTELLSFLVSPRAPYHNHPKLLDCVSFADFHLNFALEMLSSTNYLVLLGRLKVQFFLKGHEMNTYVLNMGVLSKSCRASRTDASHV